MTNTLPKPEYVMGRTDRELSRLQIQSSVLNPRTEEFLICSGISEGMRILDVGCGIGDVALIAAGLAGSTGEVIGIDTDPKSLDAARRRAEAAHLDQVRFECRDINAYTAERAFDAVLARLVLVHTADPQSIIGRMARMLRSGDLLMLEEYDLTCWPCTAPPASLVANLQTAITMVFRRVVPHANIGVRLPNLTKAAGLTPVSIASECIIDTEANGTVHRWMAETVRSILPAMEKCGLACVAGDIDTLEARLWNETMATGAALTTPLMVRTAARKP